MAFFVVVKNWQLEVLTDKILVAIFCWKLAFDFSKMENLFQTYSLPLFEFLFQLPFQKKSTTIFNYRFKIPVQIPLSTTNYNKIFAQPPTRIWIRAGSYKHNFCWRKEQGWRHLLHTLNMIIYPIETFLKHFKKKIALQKEGFIRNFQSKLCFIFEITVYVTFPSI